MKNRWTLHVEDFGSIRSADIDVASMMLFVGENNTGKSYLASLLWGILECYDIIFPVEVPSEKSYKKCEGLIIEHFNKRKTITDQELIDAILIWFNKILNNKKDDMIRRILSYKDLKIKKLSIAFDSIQLPIEWKEVHETKVPVSLLTKSDSVGFQYIAGKAPDDKLFYGFLRFLTLRLIGVDIRASYFNSTIASSDILYLPASRTGFMLSYKLLAAELMGRENIFPLPIFHFLKRLIRAEISSETPFADIAESLEKQILKGKIVQNSQIQSFYYAPESSKASMPLHTTSSLVTELAPLIIFLKGTPYFSSLIFEEPESHLHLEAQRILAKHLVKLVNRGVPVWMTTHSDTMFQQFNNLIGSTEKRIQKLKNLSYQDDEIIKPEDIKAYQFNIAKDGKTDVVPLKLTDDGFPASNFNHAIWNLTEESMALQEDSEDDD